MVTMKKQIITVAGKPGSGKSTTSKLLAAQLGFTHYSTGDFFREIGQSRGLDVLAANKAAMSAQEIDHMVDERQKQLGETEDKFVIDARLGWLFIPSSFKVYLDLDLAIAAQRILASVTEERRVSEDLPDDPAVYAAQLDDRLASEAERYQTLYSVDPGVYDNYDLVLDTSHDSPEEIATKIITEFKKWQVS